MGVHDVLQAWRDGKKIKSRSNLTTDGQNLYSYNLRIGHTNGKKKKILKIYTSKTSNFRSMTTSKHVGQAGGYADLRVRP
jgi:hypothetical protein